MCEFLLRFRVSVLCPHTPCVDVVWCHIGCFLGWIWEVKVVEEFIPLAVKCDHCCYYGLFLLVSIWQFPSFIKPLQDFSSSLFPTIFWHLGGGYCCAIYQLLIYKTESVSVKLHCFCQIQTGRSSFPSTDYNNRAAVLV